MLTTRWHQIQTLKEIFARVRADSPPRCVCWTIMMEKQPLFPCPTRAFTIENRKTLPTCIISTKHKLWSDTNAPFNTMRPATDVVVHQLPPYNCAIDCRRTNPHLLITHCIPITKITKRPMFSPSLWHSTTIINHSRTNLQTNFVGYNPNLNKRSRRLYLNLRFQCPSHWWRSAYDALRLAHVDFLEIAPHYGWEIL